MYLLILEQWLLRGFQNKSHQIPPNIIIIIKKIFHHVLHDVQVISTQKNCLPSATRWFHYHAAHSSHAHTFPQSSTRSSVSVRRSVQLHTSGFYTTNGFFADVFLRFSPYALPVLTTRVLKTFGRNSDWESDDSHMNVCLLLFTAG